MTSLVDTRPLGGGVWRVTLMRPQKRNALSVEMCTLISEALHTCVTEGARVVLLDAAGPVFSAGADLNEPDFHSELYPALERLVAAMQRLPLPIVAYVDGPAIGAGMLLAMACDLRLVGETSGVSFSLPVTTMAIGVDSATVRTLELLVGGSLARQILMAGHVLSADQAAACGFAQGPMSAEEAEQYARHLGELAPLTLTNLKREFAHSSAQPYSPEELHTAREAAWLSDDNKKVHRAREEKRPPRFTGR